MRGIVILPEYEAVGSHLEMNYSDITPRALRQYLLYWDKIDYPANSMFYFASSEEVKYLEGIGILKRTLHMHDKDGIVDFEEMFLNMQLTAFKENNKNKDECWSIAQSNTKKLILPKNDSIENRCIQIELYNSLPVPSENVSLDDILNFKEHRYHELMEFRELMDEIYLSIINSGDIELSKNHSIAKLQNKIIELNKVMNESKIQRLLSNFKIEIDVGNLIGSSVSAIGGYAVGSTMGFPTIGATLGLASSFIKTSYEMSLKPKEIPQELKDYAYLYYQSKELM
jgi:hypothetical protein